MGMLRRKRILDEMGKQSFIDSMEIGVTVDERISEGFYFIKSMHLLQDYLNNPEKLMERPTIPSPTPTLKEVKRYRRAAKKARRRQKREDRKSA
jgi:hypothetical protein